MSLLALIAILAAALAGAAAGYFLPSSGASFQLMGEQKDLEQARLEAERIQAEAHEKAKEIQKAIQEEEKSAAESLQRMEEIIQQKEAIYKGREEKNQAHQKALQSLSDEFKSLQEERESVLKKSIDQLAKTSGMNKEKALEHARKEIEQLITEGKEKRQKAELEEFEDDLMRHARAVLQVVIQRLGVQSSVDRNTTSLHIRDDNFKGLLIGKAGGNIAYLESLLPVSIIFNLGDPDTIHVGGLNLLRRNIAKRAIRKLEKLVKKTKSITHTMIKEAVDQSEKEIMDECDAKGKWAYKQMGMDYKQVDPELVNYTGRLYFRTSYGQNIIHHSLEMAYAARLIAELIGVDEMVAMQAAFYHDLGKAIDHDVGGSHDDLSKEILEKHHFDPAIVHAAYAHHDKVPCEAPADFIVKAVDAISGGRPGARQESVTNYFERIKQLEDAAKSFEGVNKVHAMSAGRELRILVNKDQIGDKDMEGLAENIAEKISDEIGFPGIIKVNLIRQTKSVDYARDKSRH